jgi:predicted nucleotidyltransferase
VSSLTENLRFGLSKKTVSILITALSKHAAIDRAIIYGSRAKGNYREGSDIDLTLDASDLSTQDLSRLWHELDESSLPYLFDISKLQDIQNPDLLEHIQRVGIVLFERTTQSS